MTNKTQITQLYGILLEAQLDLDNLRAQATQHRQEQARRCTQDRGQTRVAEAWR
jgi:hypothetical protein